MRSSFYQTLFIFILFSFLISCEEETDDCNCPDNIASVNSARQLSFAISLSNQEHGFIYLEKIDSIKIKIDDILFNAVSSETIDTTGETQLIYNNIPFVQSKREYLVMLPGKSDTSHTQTVGEFIGLLDNTPVLTPGNHIFEIYEIRFKNLMNQLVVLKPQIYNGFIVTQSDAEIFIGSFEISFNE
jgi:hypothetical protein